ncbi:MAG: U32 family peptidase [Tissierellales bacterium]|jgi:putative protease|nr:U32 family peptidase [Tissierellales bacterium]
MNKIELLAPAGSLEKLKMAIRYGADAVYIGGRAFGLRAQAKNFSKEEMQEGVDFAHEYGKKVFVTLNIIAHNDNFSGLKEYVLELEEIGVDAVIVADPGVMCEVQAAAPDMEIHLSTQANCTNYNTANFWHKNGVQRVVTAREMSLREIKELSENTPDDLEIESFVHGAMCISYSGRCLLSNFMTGRDANRGACAQACRWKYHLMEEKRPGEYYPVYEDETGTFIFNSKDLCMIEHIPELIEAGITSFKIEGRMKSAYYVATIIRAYRMAIDSYYENPEDYKFDPKWLEEIKKASYRDFTTGFYFGKPGSDGQLYANSSYIRNYDFLGLVLDFDSVSKIATIEQRNKFVVGEKVEVFGPSEKHHEMTIEKIWNSKGVEVESAPHAQEIVKVKVDVELKKWFMLRKEREEQK